MQWQARLAANAGRHGLGRQLPCSSVGATGPLPTPVDRLIFLVMVARNPTRYRAT